MSNPQRFNQRPLTETRPISFTMDFQKSPLSSLLVEYGDTKVICSVSFSIGVPRFLKGTQTGWLTAEYSMLPSATSERSPREVSKGKPSGRTMEIQRLIGRVLRNCVDLEALGENTLTVDCDVLQADGGTRTAAITGASVALKVALDRLVQKKKIPAKASPMTQMAAAISVGVLNEEVLIDLDYHEDSHAQTDMNFVFSEKALLEIGASAEEKSFSKEQFQKALDCAEQACQEIHILQEKAYQSIS